MGETHELVNRNGQQRNAQTAEVGKTKPDRRARLRRILLPVLAAGLLAGGAAGGWYWWTVGRFVESTDDAYVRSDVAVISPQVEGYVRAVWVADNQAVRGGDVLVTIDDRDFKARAAAAEAELAARAAAVQSMTGQITLQRSLIDQAEAAVPRVEADLTLARQNHQRYQRLARDDFASGQRFETATADLRKAEASLAEGQAALASARNRQAVLEAELTKAEAERRQAQASLELARTDLDRTVIRAPEAGVIGNKGVRVGELVRPGDQLMALVPLPEIYVVANFKETQLDHMRPGQPVEIEVDALPGHRFEGRVESFAPGTGSEFSLLPPENATGNFTKIVQRVPVRIAVPAGGPLAGLLRPGLSVVASVDTRAPGETRSADGGVIGLANAGTLGDR
jgi:membrane fusion protein (multidrug efflux system)